MHWKRYHPEKCRITPGILCADSRGDIQLTRVTTVQPTLSPRSFEQTIQMATMMVAEGQKKIQLAAEQKQEVEKQKKHISDPMDID